MNSAASGAALGPRLAANGRSARDSLGAFELPRGATGLTRLSGPAAGVGPTASGVPVGHG